MVEGKANEALRKLNQGIEESKQMVRHKSMALAQEYFVDSVEALKRKMEESRSVLEELPEQIRGADEGPFQMMFLELMNNYADIEEALDEAGKNVANLNMEEIAEQGEFNATEAARREASKLGVDLTQVEGTGTEGSIIISDVFEKADEDAKNKAEELGVDIEEVEGSGFNGLVTADDVVRFAEAAQAEKSGSESENGQGPRATNAALRKAEELGVDLNEIQGTGTNGLITIKDLSKA